MEEHSLEKSQNNFNIIDKQYGPESDERTTYDNMLGNFNGQEMEGNLLF